MTRTRRRDAHYISALVKMRAVINELLTVAIVTALLSGCDAQTPAPVDTTADAAALKEVTVTWFKAYNGGDAATGAGLYAEDAVLMPPHAPVMHGRAAIQKFL